MARRLRITYGTLTTGATVGASALTLDGVHALRKDAESFQLEATLLLTTPDGVSADANFAADCATVEEALRTPDGALKVEILTTGGAVASTLLDLSVAGKTATNLQPTAHKTGSNHDTIRSRRWSFSVEGGLPSLRDVGGDSAGLRDDLTIRVEFSPSCRGTLSLDGTYTAAPGGLSASARYLALAPTRTAAVVTALGGTWSLFDHSYETNDADTICTFTRTLREVIFKESDGATDHPAISDQALQVERTLNGANGGRDDTALQRITARYEARICKTITQEIRDLYADTIRPHILAEMLLVAGGQSIAVMAERPDFDPVENVLTVALEGLAVGSGSTIASSQTVSIATDFGAIFRGVWPDQIPAKEVPTPAYVFQGEKTITKTTTKTATVLGTAQVAGPVAGGGGGEVIPVGFGGEVGLGLNLADPFDNFAGVGVTSKPGDVVFQVVPPQSAGNPTDPSQGNAPGQPDRLDWVLISRTDTVTPRTLGLSNGHQIDVSDKETTTVERARVGVPTFAPTSQPASVGTTQTR